MAVDVLLYRSVFRVAGSEASLFLHRLLTQRMDTMASGEARAAGFLSPQGKVLADLLIFRDSEGVFWLDAPQQALSAVLQKLNLYRLRADVQIESCPSLHVGAAETEADFRTVPLRFCDPRHPDLGWRAYGHFLASQSGEGNSSCAYHTRRYRVLQPELGIDAADGELFPHELHMDISHSLDFKKGCYVGQEIVSRMEHRGTNRKRFVRVQFADATRAPSSGAAIMAGDSHVGTLGGCFNGFGLALFRLDRLEDAQNAGLDLMVDGQYLLVDTSS